MSQSAEAESILVQKPLLRLLNMYALKLLFLVPLPPIPCHIKYTLSIHILKKLMVIFRPPVSTVTFMEFQAPPVDHLVYLYLSFRDEPECHSSTETLPNISRNKTPFSHTM